MTAACRANCGTPLDSFLVEWDGHGLHPTCRQEPEPVVPRLASILERHQQGFARSKQRHIGPSEIGVDCDRALAYRMFAPDRIETLKWAPLLGTWAHAGIAEALAQENRLLKRERYLIERRVSVSTELGITGQVDAYDQDTDEVIDWKLTGKTRMAHYIKHGPGPTYRIQAHLYGLGWRNEGKTPTSVRVVFLPKWSASIDDAWEWAEPFNPALAEDALRRLSRVKFLATTVAVEAEPRNFSLIPANEGDECTYCPFRRSGGPADASGCPGNTSKLAAKAKTNFEKGLLG